MANDKDNRQSLDSLKDIYQKEQAEHLEVLAQLKAKTPEELQELERFESRVKAITPDQKAVQTYQDLHRKIKSNSYIIHIGMPMEDFLASKFRFNLYLTLSAGLFIFSVAIVPKLAESIHGNSSSANLLFWMAIFAVILSPITVLFIHSYKYFFKYLHVALFYAVMNLFWGLLIIRLYLLPLKPPMRLLVNTKR